MDFRLRPRWISGFLPPLLFLLVILWCVLQAQFREAITRMESLMEEEAKDSVSSIKNLRDKAMLAKGRYVFGCDLCGITAHVVHPTSWYGFFGSLA